MVHGRPLISVALKAYLAIVGVLLAAVAPSTLLSAGQRTVVLQPDDVIPTNTPAFGDYAFKTVLAQANLVATAWKLNLPLPIQSNHVTRFIARPKVDGASVGVHVAGRFGFGVGNGAFSLFRDEQFWIQPYAYNDEKMDWLATMTNVLTKERAVVLAVSRLQQLGLDDPRLALGDPAMLRQWKYDSNGVVYPLPYYEVRWQATNRYLVVNMGISGVTSNLVEFDHNIPAEILRQSAAKALCVPTPTNYLQMLGLPTNVHFLPHDYQRREKLMRELQPEPPLL